MMSASLVMQIGSTLLNVVNLLSLAINTYSGSLTGIFHRGRCWKLDVRYTIGQETLDEELGSELLDSSFPFLHHICLYGPL